jgi:hypothetical protein
MSQTLKRTPHASFYLKEPKEKLFKPILHSISNSLLKVKFSDNLAEKQNRYK